MQLPKIIALITLTLFIFGCAPSGIVLDADYRKGGEGLQMSFMKNMPTDTVFVGEQFSIGLQLTNKGAADIENGKITISGFEKGQYEFLEGNTKEFNLPGRSQYISQGDSAPLIFPVKSICYPAMAEQIRTNVTTTFRATACYSYETIATADICIDSNPLSSQSTATKSCQVKTVNLPGGQGGPLGVTSIEPTMIPTENGVKARLLITLRNLDDGIVYSRSAYSEGCSDHTLQDKVMFEAQLGGQPLICNPYGELTLRLGEDTKLSCEAIISSEQGVYETPFKMDLYYAYSEDITKRVNVERVVGVEMPACN